MLFEGAQQQLQEGLAGEEGGLVHLLLPQVKVVVHGLHEGTQEVHAGMADPVVLPLQSSHYLLPHYVTETRGERGGERGREGHIACIYIHPRLIHPAPFPGQVQ